jgi:Skp family chaperone for outer membrane proteins
MGQGSRRLPLPLELLKSAALDEVSRPGESAGDFRVRLAQKGRERRDAEVAKLREKYGAKAARLQDRIRRAEQAKERQEEQARSQKWQTGLSFGATVLGALFGRKTLSKTNLSKVGSAVRGVGRSLQESKDVEHAEENLEALRAEEKELNAALEAEVAALEARFDPAAETLETVALKTKKSDVEVRTVLLAWAPRRGGEPAWG